MAGVSVDRVVKSFGHVNVLREVSFDAEDGEFVALVGPSGCGKSTLLRTIAGLEAVNGGTISIGGRVVNDIEPKERDAAMVFQNYALYPHMTVRQNMGFSLKLRRGTPSEIEARVTEAAGILGLAEYLNRYPRQLSGGQRQRVAMGRAIVRKPSVFLFDEPLSNLDAALRVQMRMEIRNLHNRLGVTSIYVTHDQIEAMTMADKIVVMRSGVVEQAGPPLELYDGPCNTFVATFIGSPAMNLIDSEVRDGTILMPDGQLISLPQRFAKKTAKKSRQVKIGLRPEHMTISTEKMSGGFSAIVETSESTGHVTYLNCSFSGTLLSVLVSHRMLLKKGQVVNLSFDHAHLHLFDAESGHRLEQ